jgi:hypothetical protein
VTNYYQEIVKICPKTYPQAKFLVEAYKSICALNSDINEQTEVAKTGYLCYKLGKTITGLPQGVKFLQIFLWGWAEEWRRNKLGRAITGLPQGDNFFGVFLFFPPMQIENFGVYNFRTGFS